MERILRYFRYAIYSLPLQLLLLHIKRHPFLLLFWVILFASVLEVFGVSYGIPMLFLDPEYLGHVNFLSFLLVGLAMGGFIMAWNVSFYILNSYRFEFLAAFSYPFVQFSLNNTILPFSFTGVYVISIVFFQHTESLLPVSIIIQNIAALLLGNLLVIIISSILFAAFHPSIELFIQRILDKFNWLGVFRPIQSELVSLEDKESQWRVESFIRLPFNISLVRTADFYDKKLVYRALFLHHRGAFIFQLFAIACLIALGKLIENPYYRLPASASVFLVFSVLIVFLSFFNYIFRGWKVVAMVLLILILNFLTQYGWVVYKHKVYGLDYKGYKIPYNNEAVNNAVNASMVEADILKTKSILSKWHSKMYQKYGESKPKMFFINTAGGGLKSTYWTFYVLQELERQTGSKLFDHTFLMSGASGGMIGAAYFRELYFQQKNKKKTNCLDPKYLEDAGKDLLNGVGTSIATNDIFFPWRDYTYMGLKYKKDRGYIFNQQLNENTHFEMSKLMSDYAIPEQNAEIPMMVISGTIINDQRFLFFSPQDISYLVRPYIKKSKGYFDNLSSDAVEYKRFFNNKGSQHLNFVDVLRINSTYPYIMPAVYLPTTPEVKVLDAGLRENSGFSVSTRFYSVFKDWIDEHTGGVVFISIRVDSKTRDFDPNEKETYISELLSPLGSIFNNLMLLQDYNSDIGLSYLENSSVTDVSVLNFNYDQSKKRNRAAMNWHLTQLEKLDIRTSFTEEKNKLMLKKLKVMLDVR